MGRTSADNFSNDQILRAITSPPAIINPNVLYNPSGAVNQRVGPYSVTGSGSTAYTYTMDRWALVAANGQTATASQVNLGGGQYAMRFGRASGSSTGLIKFIQPLTFDQSKSLIGQNAMLSFLMQTGGGLNPNTTIQAWLISSTATTETSNFLGTITGATTLTQGSYAPGTTETRYTLGTQYQFGPSPANSTQFSLEFWIYPYGSYSGSDWVQIRNVKLEAGGSATTYIDPDFISQYNICRSFYQKSYELNVAPKTNNAPAWQLYPMSLNGSNIPPGWIYGAVYFRNPMRATPSVTTYSVVGSVATAYSYFGTTTTLTDSLATTAAVNNVTSRGFTVYNGYPSGIGTGSGNGVASHWVADGEIY